MLVNRDVQEGGIILVNIIGRLELTGRDELIKACETTNAQKLIIDLSFVSYISSEGVQILTNIAIDKGIPKPNVVFVSSLEERVEEKLEMMGISQCLTFFPDAETAIATLRGS